MKNEILRNQTLISSFIRDSNSRAELEGKELFKLLDISKDTFQNIIITSGRDYNIFVFVDSIDCYTCFQFHNDHINEFSKLGVPVLIHSTIHTNFLRNSLHKSIDLSQKIKKTDKPISNYNMIVLLINKEGKIIYADVADKTNYEKSRKFYSKISSLISIE